MPDLAVSHLDHMRGSVFFEGPERHTKLSRFWILLVLAAIIASAGVVADSTATVIGAMIVAPLMTPILGTMLGVVLGDRTNTLRSIALVLAGASAAIAIGFVVGLMVFNDVDAAANSQVAGRVTPRLIDLLAALATGVVGSVALVRRDISDTLPGVAIAISLVPPLTVVGLTMEAGEFAQAAGAMLLFATNVAAILTTGVIVMAIYKVHRVVDPSLSPERRAINRQKAVIAIIGYLAIVGVPLTISSTKIARDTSREANVRTISTTWADSVGWELLDVQSDHLGVTVRLIGPPPLPDTDTLATALDAGGVDPADVVVEFIPKATVQLGG